MIDADKLGHEAYLPDTECYRSMVDYFGDTIIDSSTRMVDRRVLGSIVFGDPTKLAVLEGLAWPAIGFLISNRIEELKASGNRLIVVEAAVLFSAGWEKYTDEVWFVKVDNDLGCQRLMSRNDLSREQAEMRLNKQVDVAQHIDLCRVVIDNSSLTLDELTNAVTAEISRLKIF